MSKKKVRGGTPSKCSHRFHRKSGKTRKPPGILMHAQRESEKLKVIKRPQKFLPSIKKLFSE